MGVLSQYLVRYFCKFILVFVLSQVAICVENSNGTIQQENSQSIVDISTKSSKDTPVTGANDKRQLPIEMIAPSDSSLLHHSENTTSKLTISHDLTSNNTVSGLTEHSTDSTNPSKQTTANNSTTLSSVTFPSSTSHVSDGSATSLTPTLVAPTNLIHRKSKPEETHIDDIILDSGPTTDYVVPLVVAMLAVPLVGVLCALLYMKGRDFWERRHYGRIDFLWDSRNDSRMDFLIDGMYRE